METKDYVQMDITETKLEEIPEPENIFCLLWTV